MYFLGFLCICCSSLLAWQGEQYKHRFWLVVLFHQHLWVILKVTSRSFHVVQIVELLQSRVLNVCISRALINSFISHLSLLFEASSFSYYSWLALLPLHLHVLPHTVFLWALISPLAHLFAFAAPLWAFVASLSSLGAYLSSLCCSSLSSCCFSLSSVDVSLGSLFCSSLSSLAACLSNLCCSSLSSCCSSLGSLGASLGSLFCSSLIFCYSIFWMFFFDFCQPLHNVKEFYSHFIHLWTNRYIYSLSKNYSKENNY